MAWRLRIYVNDQVHGGCIIERFFTTEGQAKLAQNQILDNGIEFTCPTWGPARICIPWVHIHHIFRWDDAVVSVPDPPEGTVVGD